MYRHYLNECGGVAAQELDEGLRDLYTYIYISHTHTHTHTSAAHTHTHTHTHTHEGLRDHSGAETEHFSLPIRGGGEGVVQQMEVG